MINQRLKTLGLEGIRPHVHTEQMDCPTCEGEMFRYQARTMTELFKRLRELSDAKRRRELT